MNVIVTGAASGIGCRIATLLSQAGHEVLATDVDEGQLRASAEHFSWATATVGVARHDVTSPESWQDLLSQARERWTTVDCLINVAGVLRVESVHELKPESVVLQLDVNAKGVILGTHAAASVMVPRRHGQIINIASMAALAPVPGISVYSASKFAVRGFSLAAAQELEPHGVRVCVVCPDAVDTPMVDYQLDFAGAALTFSGPRILSTDEVARAVVGLLDGRPRTELVIPWSRGMLAKLSTFFPRSFHRWLSGQLTRKGLARQRQMRSLRESDESPPART